jgi:hypothetical protein
MRTSGIILGFVVAAIIGAPVLWLVSGALYQEWNSYTHRFRLALEVDTPDGVKTGSSVIRVTTEEHAPWLPVAHFAQHSVRGDAVFVELGRERQVIATLGFGPSGNEDILANLAVAAIGQDKPFWYREAPSQQGRAELTGRLIPTLVTFADLNDPKTARVVRPEEFEQVFGSGVRFKRAYVEMVSAGIWPFREIIGLRDLTGEPITRGIEKKLPWWNGPGRPAEDAYRAWRAGQTFGSSIEPERLFRRN